MSRWRSTVPKDLCHGVKKTPTNCGYVKNGEPHQLYTRDPNAPFTSPVAAASFRLPSGHPEAFFEAFANIYRAAYDNMALRIAGQKFEAVDTLYPNVYDGAEGMYFIQQSVASSNENGKWLPMKYAQARR